MPGRVPRSGETTTKARNGVAKLTSSRRTAIVDQNTMAGLLRKMALKRRVADSGGIEALTECWRSRHRGHELRPQEVLRQGDLRHQLIFRKGRANSVKRCGGGARSALCDAWRCWESAVQVGGRQERPALAPELPLIDGDLSSGLVGGSFHSAGVRRLECGERGKSDPHETLLIGRGTLAVPRPSDLRVRARCTRLPPVRYAFERGSSKESPAPRFSWTRFCGFLT